MRLFLIMLFGCMLSQAQTLAFDDYHTVSQAIQYSGTFSAFKKRYFGKIPESIRINSDARIRLFTDRDHHEYSPLESMLRRDDKIALEMLQFAKDQGVPIMQNSFDWLVTHQMAVATPDKVHFLASTLNLNPTLALKAYLTHANVNKHRSFSTSRTYFQPIANLVRTLIACNADINNDSVRNAEIYWKSYAPYHQYDLYHDMKELAACKEICGLLGRTSEADNHQKTIDDCNREIKEEQEREKSNRTLRQDQVNKRREDLAYATQQAALANRLKRAIVNSNEVVVQGILDGGIDLSNGRVLCDLDGASDWLVFAQQQEITAGRCACGGQEALNRRMQCKQNIIGLIQRRMP